MKRIKSAHPQRGKKKCVEPVSCDDAEYDLVTHKLDKSILSVKLPKNVRVEERVVDKKVKKPPLPIIRCSDKYGKTLILLLYILIQARMYHMHESALNP